jgi:hypothetical protein
MLGGLESISKHNSLDGVKDTDAPESNSTELISCGCWIKAYDADENNIPTG